VTFRVAVVGCGQVATRFHAPAFVAQPDCAIVACTSRTMDRARALASVYGATVYETVEALLDRADPDVVAITSADNAHLNPLRLALESGKHVWVEKPLHAASGQEWVTWADFEAAAEVMAHWNRRQSIVGINFNYRSMPHYRQLRADCAAGELGALRLVDASAHLNCWSHTIDLLRWWCGDVQEVFAYWDRGETLRRAMLLRFASGAVGSLVGAR
jgi:predicted dehydrogenase